MRVLADERHVQALDVAAGEAEQRRQQRHRGGHDEQHGQRHGEREPVQGRQAHQQDAEHRDDDDEAGEHHGPPGRRDRADGGPSWLLPLGEVAAEPGDDEQRVVDADAEADHRRGGWGPVRDVDHPAQELAERDRGAEAEHGGDQRQPHRDRGPEGEQQDDGGGEQPDAFGAERGRLGQRGDRAADLDLQGVVAGGEDGFDQCLGLGRG